MEYYTFGSDEKASEIKGAFEKLGYSDSELNFTFTSGLYYTIGGVIRNTHVGSQSYELVMRFAEYGDYTKLPLPIKPKFKVGNRIHRIGRCEVYDVCDVNEESQEYGLVLCGTFNRVSLSFRNHNFWEIFTETKPKYEIGQLVMLEDSLIGKVSEIDMDDFSVTRWRYKIGTWNWFIDEERLSPVSQETISKILCLLVNGK